MKNLSTVKRWSILLTSLFIIGYEWFRHEFLIQNLSPRLDTLISSIVFVFGAVVFSKYVFGLIQKVEKKRLQQEREAKALFDNSIDGIFVFNSSGYLVDMNHGAEKMFG